MTAPKTVNVLNNYYPEFTTICAFVAAPEEEVNFCPFCKSRRGNCGFVVECTVFVKIGIWGTLDHYKEVVGNSIRFCVTDDYVAVPTSYVVLPMPKEIKVIII